MGIVRKKAGVVHIHGDGKDGLEPLNELAENSDFPLKMFVPPIKQEQAPVLSGFGCERGGNIDFTAVKLQVWGILFRMH